MVGCLHSLSSESGTADDVCSKLDYPTDLIFGPMSLKKCRPDRPKQVTLEKCRPTRVSLRRFAKEIGRRSIGGHIPLCRPVLTLKGSKVYKGGNKSHLAKFLSSFGAAAAPARTHRCAASSERSQYTAHRSCGRPASPRPDQQESPVTTYTVQACQQRLLPPAR